MATRSVPTLPPAVVKLEADAGAVVDLRRGQRVLLHVGVNGLPNSCSQLSYLYRNPTGPPQKCADGVSD